MNKNPRQNFIFRVSCVAALVFVLLTAAIPLFSNFFEKIESALYDMRVRLGGPVLASKNIVLLNIDDASLEELGKWPWDREIHAEALETLTNCEAGLVVYDIIFHGQGSSKGDAYLIKAIRENGNVILPAGFSLVHDPERIMLNLNDYASALSRSQLDTDVPDLQEALQADRSFMPMSTLADSAAAIGHISASPDKDGTLRRIPLAISVNGQPLPSIDLVTAMRMLNIKKAQWTENAFELEGNNSKFNIPVDEEGRMAVNFAGRWGEAFTRLSFHDVIAAFGDPEAESDLKELVKGKTVLVSLTSSGSTDIGPTPVSGAEPLVTIHSNAINTILQQAFIKNAPQWATLLTAITIVGAIFLLAVRFGPRRFVLASATLITVYAAGNTALFVATGIMLNMSSIIHLSVSAFLVTLGLKSLILFAENEDRRIEREKLQVQLDAAARIQSHFWPEIPDLGNGSSIFAYSSPALFVGGDLYDIIPQEDGSWIIYLADVSGKGLPAALVMASAWTQIRSHAARFRQPDKLLTAVNRDLFPFLVRDSNFVTIMMLRYFPDSGRLQWVNGGHMQPLIFNKDGAKEIKGSTCMPLGIFDETEYRMDETVLQPGESIIMMSDGVTEAQNSTKELFGENRVIEALLPDTGSSRGRRLAEAVNAWREGFEQNDDTTIVEVRRD